MMKKLCSTFLGSTSFCFLKSFMRITYDLYQEMGKQLLDDWQTVDVSTGCDVALGLTQNSMFVLFFGINLEVSGAVKNGTILSFTVACGDPWWSEHPSAPNSLGKPAHAIATIIFEWKGEGYDQNGIDPIRYEHGDALLKCTKQVNIHKFYGRGAKDRKRWRKRMFSGS